MALGPMGASSSFNWSRKCSARIGVALEAGCTDDKARKFGASIEEAIRKLTFGEVSEARGGGLWAPLSVRSPIR